MASKFNAPLFFRSVLLMAALLTFCYSLLHEQMLFTVLISGFLSIVLFLELNHAINKTNRELSRIINALLNDDFSIRFPSETKQSSFQTLYQSFNRIALYFKQMKHKKEAQHEFLLRQFELLNTGLITWNSKSEIMMMNKAAQDILNVPRLATIQRLGEFIPELQSIVATLLPGEGRLLQLTSTNAIPKTIGLKLNTFIVEEEAFYTLIISNLKDEAEQKEIESFQKLISVLTHEVMNTMTPISSLSNSLSSMIETNDCANEEIQNDIKTGLRTIKKRSETILNFVENYRKILKTPQPNLTLVAIDEFLEDTIELMRPDAERKAVNIQLQLQKDIHHHLDPDLMHLVITNLIKNALEAFDALPQEKQIVVKTYKEQQHLFIEITDNGMGISPQAADKIFVPFYTSKDQGSGIGLSFSRQVVKAHGGILRLKSSKPGYTCFEIRL